ncbi:MAG: ADOP family duplicated permease [Vicinamibacterales bacterium]
MLLDMLGPATDLTKELRWALRSWRKAPVVAAVAIASLGLGIGVTTTIFAAANTLLFSSSSGVEAPDRVVRLYTSGPNGERYGATSYPDFVSLTSSLDAIDEAAVSLYEPMVFGRTSSRVLFVEKTSPNFFSVLGVVPPLGRAFRSGAGDSGESHTVILSHDLWRSSFNADPAVIGSTIELGAEPCTVIGVTPPGLDIGNPFRRTDAWVPLVPESAGGELATRRDLRRFSVVARLADGASIENLRSQLDVVAANVHRDEPLTFADARGVALRFSALTEDQSRLPPDRRGIMAALTLFPLSIAGLVLLIACSNVATLFLARATERARDTAVRLSLGAGRGRIAVMSFAESLAPGLASGLAGLAFAWGAVRLLGSVALPPSVPLRLDLALDWRVALFALALALGTTLVSGMAPTLAATRATSLEGLRERGGGGRRGQGWRRALVTAQVAASLVLIVGCGLFYRALENVATLDIGFEPGGIAVTTRTVPEDQAEPEAARLFVTDRLARLRSTAGIADAQASSAVELTTASAGQVGVVDAGGFATGHDSVPTTLRNAVTPGYLEMLGMTLLQGRTLRETDAGGAQRVAVVNEFFARRFWPDGDAIGDTFRLAAADGEAPDPAAATYRVVGIVKDGRFGDIDDPPLPYIWTSLYQTTPTRVAFLVRGRGQAADLVPILRREIPPDEAEVVLVPPSTLDSLIDVQFTFGRVTMRVLGWAGAFGLALAMIGIYGIVSFSAACRSREIAIRVAIGADRRQVTLTLVREGLVPTVTGLVLGAAVVLPLASLLEAQLLGVSPADPITLVAGCTLLLGAALAASLVPARRASRVDPLGALREG